LLRLPIARYSNSTTNPLKSCDLIITPTSHPALTVLCASPAHALTFKMLATYQLRRGEVFSKLQKFLIPPAGYGTPSPPPLLWKSCPQDFVKCVLVNLLLLESLLEVIPHALRVGLGPLAVLFPVSQVFDQFFPDRALDQFPSWRCSSRRSTSRQSH
jgi:hypothetical protein